MLFRSVISFVVAALQLPQVVFIVPARYAPAVAALVAVLALLSVSLRTFVINNPVTLIAPGQVKPIEVKKLEATKPGTEDPSKLPPTVQDQTARPPNAGG